MKSNIAHIDSLLNTVPEEDQPQGEELARFWKYAAWEMSQLIRYAAYAPEPEIVFSDMRQAGSQYIWEFWVNDLALPVKDEYNWHFQNTSQWKYAGCICLQNGRVSSHH